MCCSKRPKCLSRRYLRRNAAHKCGNHKGLRDQHQVRTQLHRGAAGNTPSARAECSRRSADRPSWISAADRKRGFEGVLWYQDLSRVCPRCPQATPSDGGGRGVIFGRLMVNTALSTVKGPAKFPEVRCGPGTDLSE